MSILRRLSFGPKQVDSNNFKIATSRFDDEELKLLQLTWQELANRSNGKGIDKETFFQYFPLNGLLGERLFVQFDRKKTGFVDLDDYTIGLSIMCRGTMDDKIQVIFKMFDVSQNNFVSKEDMSTLLNHIPRFVLQMYDSLPGEISTTPTYRSRNGSHAYEYKASDDSFTADVDQWTNQYIVDQAFEDCDKSKTGMLSYEEFKIWIERNPAVVEYIESALPGHKCRTPTPRKNKDKAKRVRDGMMGKDDNDTQASVDGTNISDLVLKEGYLWKRGNTLHMWSKRYNMVLGNCVYYYASKDDVRPKGVIFLTGCLIERINDSDLAAKGYYGFQMHTQDFIEHDQKQRILYCNTEKDRDDWVTILQHAAAVVPIEDDYILGDELGRGKYSIVREGINKKTYVNYAVKIIQKVLSNAEERSLLRTEIAVLKLVNHPNIVRLQGVYEDKRNMYIVMEKLSGGELFNRIVGRAQFSDAETAKLIKPLLESVAYLHDLGIVHRDLKPENILCGDNLEDLKIADFGLSRITLPHEKMDSGYGTLSYTAPEELTNADHGKEADLWSVGVIMFLVMYGRLPFDGKDEKETTGRIIAADFRANPRSWGKISREARGLIKSLLTRDPAKRITAREALRHPFLIQYYPLRRMSSAVADQSPRRASVNSVVGMDPPVMQVSEMTSHVLSSTRGGDTANGKIPLPRPLQISSTDSSSTSRTGSPHHHDYFTGVSKLRARVPAIDTSFRAFYPSSPMSAMTPPRHKLKSPLQSDASAYVVNVNNLGSYYSIKET